MPDPIPYGKHFLTEADIEAVTEVLRSDFLTQGPTVLAFEKAFAAYIGCEFAVAVSNGTAALHLSALALDVNPGVKIITSPITFSASANCVLYCGGEVQFSDIDPETLLLDPEKVRLLLESQPKGTFQGIIPVDFAGYPVKMDLFKGLALEHGLWILEDSCHAPGGSFSASGSTYKCGDGKLAELAIFSFHPVKHIATGEGGMITTNDPQLYQKLLKLRTHGITKDPALMAENHGGWYMEMQELGYNYRLTDFQAALGISQLKRAAENLQRRKRIAEIYDEAFAETPIQTIKTPRDKGHAYHLYIVQVQDRKGMYDFLKANGIFTQVHYIPVHTMPFYQRLGWKYGDFPFAEAYYEKCLSLPMYPALSGEEQDYVIRKVLEYASIKAN